MRRAHLLALIVILTASGVLAGATREEVGKTLAGQSSGSSDAPNGLLVSLETIDSGVFSRKGPIPMMLVLTNRNESDIFACLDPKGREAHLVSFEVFDIRKNAVRLLERFDTESPILEKTHLIRLRAGEERALLLDLTSGGAVYDFSKGEYFAVAVYKCPFHGTRGGESKIPIVDEVQRSNAVRFLVK